LQSRKKTPTQLLMNKKPHSNSRSQKSKTATAGELRAFEICESQGGGFGITIDGEALLLPYGKPFWSPSRAYAEHTLKIFSEGGPEHFNNNRTLVCHACTLFIDFSSGIVAPEEEAISGFKKNPGYLAALDPIHALCAGPEVVDQLTRLQPFQNFCADRGIIPPNWPQGGVSRPGNTTDIGEIVRANADEWTASSTLRYFEALEREFRRLSGAQISVMHTYMNFCGGYQGAPFVLPLLLVKGLCTPREFAEGFLATLCIIPGVFGDVSAAEYKREFAKIKRDAERALFFLKHH
jgi:hypothetical protein